MEESVRLADELRERLAGSDAVADVWPEYCRPLPRLSLDVDRAQVKDRGVSLDDVMNTLQVYLGEFRVNDRAGRVVRVSVRSPGEKGIADLKMLKVRNSKGETVALGDFTAMRVLTGTAFLRRIDGERCLLITARPPAGVTADEARRRCRDLVARARKELKLPEGCTIDILDPTR
jgi:multidrug efflux pump subunit AcrB